VTGSRATLFRGRLSLSRFIRPRSSLRPALRRRFGYWQLTNYSAPPLPPSLIRLMKRRGQHYRLTFQSAPKTLVSRNCSRRCDCISGVSRVPPRFFATTPFPRRGSSPILSSPPLSLSLSLSSARARRYCETKRRITEIARLPATRRGGMIPDNKKLAIMHAIMRAGRCLRGTERGALLAAQ